MPRPDLPRRQRSAAWVLRTTLATVAMLSGAACQGLGQYGVQPEPPASAAPAAPTAAPTADRTLGIALTPAGSIAVPTRAPTPPHTAAPTAAPTAAGFTSGLSLSWEHFTGYSEVCFGLVTSPMQPGKVATLRIASASGQGIRGPAIMTPTLDAAGAARGRFTILRHDTFTVRADFGDTAPGRGFAEGTLRVVAGPAPTPCR